MTTKEKNPNKAKHLRCVVIALSLSLLRTPREESHPNTHVTREHASPCENVSVWKWDLIHLQTWSFTHGSLEKSQAHAQLHQRYEDTICLHDKCDSFSPAASIKSDTSEKLLVVPVFVFWRNLPDLNGKYLSRGTAAENWSHGSCLNNRDFSFGDKEQKITRHPAD